MISILYLLVAVPIVVNINPSPLEVFIQVKGIGEKDQREEILTDKKEKEIDGRGTGATTAVNRIETGTVGIGKAIGTEAGEERMILITEKAVHKTEVEDTPLDQEVIAITPQIDIREATIGAVVSDTATPRKKPTPLLVDIRETLPWQERLKYRMMEGAGVGEVTVEGTVVEEGQLADREGIHRTNFTIHTILLFSNTVKK